MGWDGNKLKPRDLYDRFVNTGRIWYENALHQRAMVCPYHRRGTVANTRPLSDGVIVGRRSRGVSMLKSKQTLWQAVKDRAADIRTNRARPMVDHHQMSIQEALTPTISYASVSPASLSLPCLVCMSRMQV